MYLKLAVIFFLSIVYSHGDVPCNKIYSDYGFICACNSTYCDTLSPPEQLPAGQFHFYYTSRQSPGFNHETSHFRMQAFSPHGFKYKVNKSKTFQKVRGFGGSFTDSFGATLNTLSEEVKEKLLGSFFSEDGIEYSTCRVVIGSSDFSLRNYTYVPTYDPSLKSFNLTEDDYIYKIAHMKKAINISKKRIHFLGSTWNAPHWMKSGNTSGTGFLDPKFRQQWADYLVKTLDAFRSEGIEFWSLTTGNEPVTLYMIPAMDILVMFPEEQREWIINNLGPALEKANYSMKVVVLDDMRLYALWWMDRIMRDRRSEKYVLGVGLHYYMDWFSSLDTLDILHEKYPNQEVVYTESSMNILMNAVDQNDTDPVKQKGNILHDDNRGGPHLGSWKRGGFYAMNIIENLNHWTTTYIDWNLALNEQGGPNMNNFPCDASIIVNETKNEFYKQPMFYVMGHFSKFILPDSVIINVEFDNTTTTDKAMGGYSGQNPSESGNPTSPLVVIPTLPPFSNDVQFVGALNPNGSISIVFYNPKTSPAELQVYDPDRGHAFLKLEPESLSTLLYW